jgi:hypothetical protein
MRGELRWGSEVRKYGGRNSEMGKKIDKACLAALRA